MADRENALGKKTIIAIIAVIVLLFIAGISVGIFLADKGSSEAVDGNQVADVNQNTDANNTNTENQKNDDNNVNSENKQNENIQAENNNNQTGENSTPDNTNIATKPDTGVQNNVTTPNNNDGTVANNGTTNNNVTANNGETDNNVTNNTEITTGTNVNEVGETTVTRVEEEEKLVSKDFWDWWTPASVLATAASAVSDTIVPTTPDFTVEKFATTKSGENVVYAGENITYTIKVTNNGEKDLNNIEITDKIPENTTFVSFDDAFNIIKGKTVIGENDEVVGVKWIVSVPGHKENEDTNSVFVRFTVNVNKMMLVEMDDGEIAEVPTTGTIANTAIANGQESNEEKTAIITSNKTSEITRDGSKVEVAKIGDEITYTIKVTNTGEVDGVTTISDNVPTGTILKENSAEGAIISENNTKLEWKNVTVPAGASVSKTFIVIVDNFDDLTENKITNVATVGGKETDEVEDPIAIDITVSKDWKDANDQDGYRPEEIYVNLLTDGKVKTTVEVKADEQGNWSYVFENLPKFENGKEIVYTVTENDVEKYTTEITGSVADGFTITNTHTPTTKNVVLTKIWDDNGDELKKRPGSVTFKINNKNYVLSALKDEDKTTLNEWTLTVKVPINNTDTVSEVPVKGYTTIYGEDGLTVTNQIMQPGKVTINSLKQSSEKINAPMDVVFVLDTSNSMSEKSSRYDENNKAQNMVNAVNNTISNIMSLNPDSRVGIVGYAGWKENNNNDYSEHPSVIVPLDNYKTIKGNYISLSGNVINVNDSITKGESRTITGGTYTQAGIKLGAEQLIKGSESKTYTGKTKDGLDYTTTRVPMLVLVTDGVPTYYIKADNAQIVEGNGWQPGINVKGDGQETNVTSDYYYWTIRTAKYYKDEVTKAYYGENSKNTSKVFTIGIGLNNNNRAKVMLNPNKDTIDAQLRRNDGLYIKLQENDNNPYKYDYAEASTTTAVTSGELEEFLEESIFGSLPNLPTIRTITAEETTSRKIYLPNIDTNKEFKLIIGTNTYNTFKEASAYIKGDATSGYYVDLTSVSKTATVEVSYWEIFTGTNS